MKSFNPRAACATVLVLLAFLPGLAQPTAPIDEGSEWLAAADSKLDSMRGGFAVAPDLMVSFGIMRTVHINGVLVSSSGFKLGELRGLVPGGAIISARAGELRPLAPGGAIPSAQVGELPPLVPGGASPSAQVGELRSLTPDQAQQLGRQTAAVSLVQTGPGNTFATAFQPGAPAIVIQNTLNNQKIQSITEINAVSNGMSILKGLNLNQTLNDALGAARR